MHPIEPASLSGPLIISAALTGSWTAKSQNPAVPITEEEIAGAAVEAWKAGAAIVHLHVRDEQGKVTCDPGRYAKARDLIRLAGSDGIINMSTGGGAGQTTDEQRMEPVSIQPEIASFDCGSCNFGATVFINSPSFLDELASRMLAHGVQPEIECFEPGHVANALRLIAEDKLKPPYWFQFVLGLRGGSPGTVKQLVSMAEMLPPWAMWSVCGIGRAQLPLNIAALSMGGHVRTGLEDNIFYHKGELAESNAQLVSRLARIAGEIGRPLATAARARSMLGLKPLESASN
ncbi:3-keto-5-aminohexanoate cleavage protein [soil metagenome]